MELLRLILVLATLFSVLEVAVGPFMLSRVDAIALGVIGGVLCLVAFRKELMCILSERQRS
jgi:hypothetical protein